MSYTDKWTYQDDEGNQIPVKLGKPNTLNRILNTLNTNLRRLKDKVGTCFK